MLAISDTGVGMDGETQTRIFEPFFHHERREGGRALVFLSTVYGHRKAERRLHLRGTVSPRRGTTFRTYFSTCRCEGGKPPPHRNSLDCLRPDRGKETILLVEDENQPSPTGAAVFWKTQGYKILEEPKMAPLLSRSSRGHKKPIDLLLTDGRYARNEWTRTLAIAIPTAERPEIRVLYMSGYTENAIGHNGMLDAGINLLQKTVQAFPLLKTKFVKYWTPEPTPLEAVMPSSKYPLPFFTGKKIPPFPRPPLSNLHLPLRYRLHGRTALGSQGTTDKHQPLRTPVPGAKKFSQPNAPTGDQPGIAGRNRRIGGD